MTVVFLCLLRLLTKELTFDSDELSTEIKMKPKKASFLPGVIEITLCYCWSNGILNYSPDLNWKVVIAGSLVTFWRSTHFYSMHRVMHPWRINGVPDIGKWLYRHVHSLHHKDRSKDNSWLIHLVHDFKNFNR